MVISRPDLRGAQAHVGSYPNDLDNSFVDELCHFAKFADVFKDDKPRNVSTVRAIFVQTDC